MRAVSVPFIDASLGRLLSSRAAGYYDTHPIVIYGGTVDVRQTVDAALRMHHLYALALGGHLGAQLLGADELLATTLREAGRLHSFNVRELAQQLDLTPQAANNRLRLLLRSGALQRERAKPESDHGEAGLSHTAPASASRPAATSRRARLAIRGEVAVE